MKKTIYVLTCLCLCGCGLFTAKSGPEGTTAEVTTDDGTVAATINEQGEGSVTVTVPIK
jgi:hypothetical protein